MLRRKIEAILKEWKSTKDKNPLVIKGIRQCGKTYIVRKFACENYKNVVYMNFVLDSEKKAAFIGSKDVDTIILNLSAMMGDVRFEPGETCIILDEIQDCRDARTSLKSFKEDGRFDVIATGSLLGVKGYGGKYNGDEGLRNSVPVGYETIVEMYPLDFEEFLWANGVNENVIEAVRGCLDNETPVPEGIHTAMMKLLHHYVVVGGLPAVVNVFLSTKDIGRVYEVQRDLLGGYEEDMVKYADDGDKARIRECFESIPKQLAKENKKFQYSVIGKGARSSKYIGSLQWLEDAAVIRRCYNTDIPQLPFEGNAISDCFKVYTTDIGLLMAMLDYGAQADVLQGNLMGYKGAIFENLVADMFGKSGKKLYYYHKESGLEIDFLLRHKGRPTLVEVKANTGRGKSVRTVLAHPEKYGVYDAIKLGNYNVGRMDKVLTLPLYMGFLLGENDGYMKVPDVDIDNLNSLA